MLGHFLAKGYRLAIIGMVRRSASGTKYGYLSAVTIRRKYLEGISQFLKRTAENFQIAAACMVGGKLFRRLFNTLNKFGHPLRCQCGIVYIMRRGLAFFTIGCQLWIAGITFAHGESSLKRKAFKIAGH